jgi:RasGEF domain
MRMYDWIYVFDIQESPAFAKLVQESNFWTTWGVSLVVQQDCHEDQVAAIEFVIDVAKGCLNLNNFNSSGGLVAAISNPAVLKLHGAVAVGQCAR